MISSSGLCGLCLAILCPDAYLITRSLPAALWWISGHWRENVTLFVYPTPTLNTLPLLSNPNSSTSCTHGFYSFVCVCVCVCVRVCEQIKLQTLRNAGHSAPPPTSSYPSPSSIQKPSSMRKKVLCFLTNWKHEQYSRSMRTKAILLALENNEFVDTFSCFIEGDKTLDDLVCLEYITEMIS